MVQFGHVVAPGVGSDAESGATTTQYSAPANAWVHENVGRSGTLVASPAGASRPGGAVA